MGVWRLDGSIACWMMVLLLYASIYALSLLVVYYDGTEWMDGEKEKRKRKMHGCGFIEERLI